MAQPYNISQVQSHPQFVWNTYQERCSRIWLHIIRGQAERVSVPTHGFQWKVFRAVYI